jgi:C_GCAxxG_C_C family probable redox protein
MLAVGEYLLGRVDDQVLCMTTGLAGGAGCAQQETCGALTSGALLIGALYGRTRSDEDDSQCQKLAAEYRGRFAQELGATLCCDLRANGYGSGGTRPCSVLVERAANILLDVLNVESNTE